MCNGWWYVKLNNILYVTMIYESVRDVHVVCTCVYGVNVLDWANVMQASSLRSSGRRLPCPPQLPPTQPPPCLPPPPPSQPPPCPPPLPPSQPPPCPPPTHAPPKPPPPRTSQLDPPAPPDDKPDAKTSPDKTTKEQIPKGGFLLRKRSLGSITMKLKSQVRRTWQLICAINLSPPFSQKQRRAKPTQSRIPSANLYLGRSLRLLVAMWVYTVSVFSVCITSHSRAERRWGRDASRC